MIYEAAHAETLVVHDSVTEVHTVDGFCPHKNLACDHVSFSGRIPGELAELAVLGHNFAAPFHGGAVDSVTLEGGVVVSVRIQVWALEEVHTDGWRIGTVVGLQTCTVNVGSVVAITQTSLHIAAHVVVLLVAEVGVHPLAEIGFGQFV